MSVVRKVALSVSQRAWRARRLMDVDRWDCRRGDWTPRDRADRLGILLHRSRRRLVGVRPFRKRVKSELRGPALSSRQTGFAWKRTNRWKRLHSSKNERQVWVVVDEPRVTISKDILDRPIRILTVRTSPWARGLCRHLSNKRSISRLVVQGLGLSGLSCR